MKNLHPAARAAIVIVGIIVALNLVIGGLDRTAGGSRPGEPSSTYTTAPDGLAAYDSLLRQNGRTVTRMREPLADAELPHAGTMFVMDGVLEPDEATIVSTFVSGGGTLVASGPTTQVWLPQIVPSSVRWAPVPAAVAAVTAPVPEVADVDLVVSPEPGVWTSSGSGLPALASDTGDLMFVVPHGNGRVVALASTSPLTNANLAEADNAALGLALAAESRPVLFVESVHGHTDGRGFAALPADARWAFALLALAACVWMVVRGRRLGPPERADRELAPPRRLYVEAVGAALKRSKRPGDAIAAVQLTARKRLAQRADLNRGDDADALRRAGVRLGLEGTEVEAILTPARSDGDVLAAGRALAKLEQR